MTTATADHELAAGAAFLVALGGLDDRERLILILRSQNVTLRTIGDRLGVGTQRVQQLEKRARKKMQAALDQHKRVLLETA